MPQPASSSPGPEQVLGLVVLDGAVGAVVLLGAVVALELLDELDELDPLEPLPACATLTVLIAGAA